MQIQILGNINILGWGLIPDRDHEVEGTVMAFTTEVDSTTKLIVSSTSRRAQLQLSRDSELFTYEGVVTEAEFKALANKYYRGC